MIRRAIFVLLLATVPIPAAFAQFPPSPDGPGGPDLLVMPSVTARLELPSIAPGGQTRVFAEITGGLGLKFKTHGTSLKAAVAAPLSLGALVASSTKEIVDPAGSSVTVFEGMPRFEVPVLAPPTAEPGRYEIRLLVDWEACSDSACLMPQMEEKLLVIEVGTPADTAPVRNAPAQALVLQSRTKAPKASAAPPPPSADGAADPSGDDENSLAKSLVDQGGFLAFLGFFLVGVGMSLTPCVFPLVPITLAVIGANEHKGTWRAFLLSGVYVLGIALTYGALGAAAAASGNALGSVQSHPAVLALIVLVFVLLALSMFDVFYLQAPAFLRDRLSGRRSKGFAGAFVAGIFAGVLAGPCTGPILAGLLTLILKTGNVLYGFLALSTVGLGMGFVLILIGTFSASLPRAGTWMEQVKNLFGFLLFLMALWFFRQLVSTEVFLVTASFFALATGLACWQLPEGSAPAGWYALLRRTFALMALVVGLYLLGGTLVHQGFLLPPLRDLLPVGTGNPVAMAEKGIPWFHEPDLAFARAKETGRLVMLDFRSDNCPQCLELERFTFPDDRVVKEAGRFVPLKADMTHPSPAFEALRSKYEVLSWPTILFLAADGKLVRRLNGYKTPEVFLEILRGLP